MDELMEEWTDEKWKVIYMKLFILELMQFSPIEIDAIQLSRSGSLASFNDVSQDKQSNII